MSFLDPFLDAFADLDDSINEEIPGGWGTIAALTAAAMTGGASAGATGGVDAAAMGSWDILPAVGEGVTAITPQTIGAAGAMAPYETTVPGIMGATGTPVVSGATPMVSSPIGSLPLAQQTLKQYSKLQLLLQSLLPLLLVTLHLRQEVFLVSQLLVTLILIMLRKMLLENRLVKGLHVLRCLPVR
jgi:hypothetical protein